METLSHRKQVKVVFKANNRYHGLFNVIQMGKGGVIDLKITNCFDGIPFVAQTQNPEKGFLTEDEIINTKCYSFVELSYHPDGSCLYKYKDNDKNLESRFNPYGKLEKWTHTSQIEDFQPIMFMCLRQMDIYKDIKGIKHNKKVYTYICENDDLFDMEGKYLILLYIRNKNFTVSRYTNSDSYSDIIANLNETSDLCIFIQRHTYPLPLPFYTETFKTFIMPFMYNSYSFCNRETAKREIEDKLKNAVFNPHFNQFLQLMSNGKFINLSEDKLQLIDEINLLYEKYDYDLSISKPIFINWMLHLIGKQLQLFNNYPSSKKQSILERCQSLFYEQLQNEPIRIEGNTFGITPKQT